MSPAEGREVVRITEDDASAVAAILASGMTEAWTEEQVRSALEMAGIWGLLLHDEGRPAAALLAMEGGGEVEVLQVAVLPLLRRQGLGRALLRAALYRAIERGARRAHLEVRASNHAARALYAAFGFEEVGLRRRYYHDGEDAVTMAKTLVPPS